MISFLSIGGSFDKFRGIHEKKRNEIYSKSANFLERKAEFCILLLGPLNGTEDTSQTRNNVELCGRDIWRQNQGAVQIPLHVNTRAPLSVSALAPLQPSRAQV